MSDKMLILENDTIQVGIHINEDGTCSLAYLLPAGQKPQPSSSPHFQDGYLPLVELRLSGPGNSSQKSSRALVAGYIGERLKYQNHREFNDGLKRSKSLDVGLLDEKTQMTVTSHLTIFEDLPFLRSSVTAKNDSSVAVVVNQMPSVVIGGMTRSSQWWQDYEVSYANNTWFREAQWVTLSLPDVGLDDTGVYGLPDKHQATLATFGISNQGSFSTQGKLPMGMLKKRDQTETWLWQIEHNGSWRWEIGDWRDDVYLAASGPTSDDHDWRHGLAPGESCTSVPVAVAHLFGNQEAAFGALTQYRRRIRRSHSDHQKLPIIFNDYMNCLMGDPTDEKILALIEPVSKAGAEYFVIDCGWYADDSNWWDDVGLWEPSKRRFPMGFENLLGKIRDAGLKPGLWIEPEVIGVRSIMASRLPKEAFFERDGQRIIEKGRYQLDFRHPSVQTSMDKVIDRCVQQYGVGYFKFDYNVQITQGTDLNCSSSGAGFLEHNRAYLLWVNRVFDRYPELLIETCSSGAQRLDYAMLSVHPLQSTSDQQCPTRYAAISASIHTAVTPEQGASWAYPQPDWSEEINALTVVNSLLGRVYLSGRLDSMKAEQLKIIDDGMRVYKDIRGDIPRSTPFWPLGLPGWHDDWLALGLAARSEDGSETGRYYLAVWRRGGSTKCKLPIAALKCSESVAVEFLYPTQLAAQSSWDAVNSALLVEFPDTICARLFRLQI
ncbi:Melibiase subfamily [Penicillium nucicola]|uniref:Melibiase subfamily n=1 Tax=Penicillium nucicola TaxID=1850975 RepID=UPI00254573D5|nr:Melibiase subfamily [Penicillium nucicola]KAJ5776357.1 Melibiase subfamily [Penicillium nucicola]